MDAVETIKSQLSMKAVAERYGLHSARSGFINCPFHTEDTPSMKIYEQPGRGFSCFGCGKSGSVIDFVMLLFSISFRQAVMRIGMDFGIIVSNDRQSSKDIERWRRHEAEKRRQARLEHDQYQALLVEHCRLWQAKKHAEPWSDIWVEALDRIDLINYRLEELDALHQRRLSQQPSSI